MLLSPGRVTLSPTIYYYYASTPEILVTAWADMHPPVDATSSGSSLHMLKNWMSSPNPSDWSQEQKMITEYTHRLESLYGSVWME
jgi:hypothetical protein